MHCVDVQNQLSPYYDGELPSATRLAVESHMTECLDCASQLSEFARCSQAIDHLPQTAVPAGVWEELSTKLPVGAAERDERLADPLRSNRQPRAVSRIPFQTGLLAMAASLLFLVGWGLWRSEPLAHSPIAHARHDAQFAGVIDHYVETLAANPEGAERFLMQRYPGRTVDSAEAVKLVGYRPAFAEGLPQGYSLASTSVMQMPCCTCLKTVCKRSDGSALVLFEHRETTGIGSVSGSPPAICSDEDCCLTGLGRSDVATWKYGTRSITAIGTQDRHEVVRLTRWLKEKHLPTAGTLQ